MNQVKIDIGYSTVKVHYNGKFYKFPSAVSYANDTGITYGDDDIYTYNKEKFYVGEAAVGGSNESFTTTDYGYKKVYDPLLLFHILKKLGLVDEAKNNNVKFFLTLALTDWKNKDDYLKIFDGFIINDITMNIKNIILLPQGAMPYTTYVNKNNGKHPDTATVIDLGFNTINFLFFQDGQPQKSSSKGFAGHGVSSILRPFTAFLESTYSMSFSEGESLKIFTRGKFTFNGLEQPIIADKIKELKRQFIHKLFGSILTSEKKILATSEVVLLAGGGCYLLEGITFPPNVTFADKPYEFANVG